MGKFRLVQVSSDKFRKFTIHKMTAVGAKAVGVTAVRNYFEF